MISVPPALNILDFLNIDFDAETNVQAVIAAAEAYCLNTGMFV
jgi:hypothetical protein